MKTWKDNLDETKKRYINWWNHKGIVVNMWEHFQEGVAPHGPYSGEQPIHLTEAARNNYGTGAFGLPGAPQAKDGNQRWFDPEWRANFLDWYVGHSCLKADMLPVANTQLGPGSLASILGSRVEGGEDTIWIHPDPNFKDKLTFDPDNEQLRIHKELLKACKRKANGNYYVGMPDLMEGLDVLAALKGTDKVLLDTVMQPEVVEEQLQFINDVYFKVFDELYDIIREGDEMAFCYFSSWAPGKMTKIQSDISTMISDDDYRRFVQPYLREQCQKIPYTLYHLDGVGAMHHLPALLEIEELNAIQWTPGVGEPQGGDPKWYDLYKKILAGGKSIMACWVTLDQLRPLLDNVGGDGIHLEMDFHNEDEVEQALRIVEEYQTHEVERKVDECLHIGDMTAFAEKKSTARFRPLHIGGKQVTIQTPLSSDASLAVSKPTLVEALEQRMLVFDGAMGTSIQSYGLTDVKSNEYLCVEHPEVITDIYRKFLLAGSDVITANTFNAQSVSLKACGLADKAVEINTAAVTLARHLADTFTVANPEKPRYVLGEMGPTRETLSMPDTAKITKQELHASYKEQAVALIEAGVDGIIFETVFDLVNLEIGLDAVNTAMDELQKTVPVLISANFSTADGKNMIGQNVIEYFQRLKNDNVIAVGVNCNPDIELTTEVIAQIAATVPYYIIAFPNAGFPDSKGNYSTTPQELQRQMWNMIDGHLVNIIGGCCGTTSEHIRKIAELVNPADGCFVSGHVPGGESTAPIRKAPKPHAEKPAEPVKEAKPVATGAITTGLKDAIIAGKEAVAIEETKKAIEAGANPAELINTQMIEAMSVVGQRFSEGKAFVPNLLMAGRAMKAALAILKPIMEASGEGVQSAGKIVIGTVKGDLHDIGKNLVASMLEGSGFEVINVGIDVDAETFVKAVIDNEADILCLSALLTTTMTYMADCLAALEVAGVRGKVKVMVGGAPVTEDFAREIGADGYSANANEAVALAKRLMAS